MKRENELVRRWKVHIFQIELGNLQSYAFDAFLQITIGGTYFVSPDYS